MKKTLLTLAALALTASAADAGGPLRRAIAAAKAKRAATPTTCCQASAPAVAATPRTVTHVVDAPPGVVQVGALERLGPVSGLLGGCAGGSCRLR